MYAKLIVIPQRGDTREFMINKHLINLSNSLSEETKGDTAVFIIIFTASTQSRVPKKWKLDPVGSTVRYEMMKLCTGSV